jgi:hypothetical protein
MQLNLEEASSVELYAYKIILLTQINENNRLIKEIDNKLNKEKENAQSQELIRLSKKSTNHLLS